MNVKTRDSYATFWYMYILWKDREDNIYNVRNKFRFGCQWKFAGLQLYNVKTMQSEYGFWCHSTDCIECLCYKCKFFGVTVHVHDIIFFFVYIIIFYEKNKFLFFLFNYSNCINKKKIKTWFSLDPYIMLITQQ